MMKEITRKSIYTMLALLLCTVVVICCTGCAKTNAVTESTTAQTDAVTTVEALLGIWSDADYTADTELGSGAKTVKVEVTAEERTVTFTLHTDKTVLGDALTEHSLITGEAGAFGLYVKTVNGMLADYDVDGTYWSLCRDGEYMQTGVDSTEIADGDSFELIRTK